MGEDMSVFEEMKAEHERRELIGTVVGGVAGILASASLGMLSKQYVVPTGNKAKDLVMTAGLGLVASTVSSAVSDDVSKFVQDVMVMAAGFKDELKSMADENRKSKEVEIRG